MIRRLGGSEGGSMELHRYTFPDPYIVADLRGRYETADAKGRVQLLIELSKNEDCQLPYEIAALAVGDTNVEVRRWIARHGRYLDYEKGDSSGQAAKPEEHNLWMRLKADPDPLVRAQLRENPGILPPVGRIGKSMQWFRESSHLERLALVRNEQIEENLIEQLFDPDETELGLTLTERYELCCAFLTNCTVIDTHVKDAGVVGNPSAWDGWTWYSARKFLGTLWLNAAKWPKGTGNLQHVVYRYVAVDDETKAKVYESCDEPVWRKAILYNSNAKRDHNTFAMALRDRDDGCRELAYSLIPKIDEKELSVLSVGEDKPALCGLADNRVLPEPRQSEVHLQVRARLSELGESVTAFGDFDHMHIARKRESRRSEASTARGRRRRLSRRLRAIQRGVDDMQARLGRLVSLSSLVLFACVVGLMAALFTRWLR